MKIRNCHPKIKDGIDLRLFPQVGLGSKSAKLKMGGSSTRAMWTSVAFNLGKSYFLRSRFNWLGCIIWKITYCSRLRHRNRVYRWGSTSPFPIPVSSDVMSYLFLIWSLLRLWVRPLWCLYLSPISNSLSHCVCFRWKVSWFCSEF